MSAYGDIHPNCIGCTHQSTCLTKNDKAQTNNIQVVRLGQLGKKFTCSSLVEIYQTEHPARKPLERGSARFHYGDVGFQS